MLINRAESHSSAARLVRQAGRKREKLPDEKMLGSGCFNHRRQSITEHNTTDFTRHCRQDTSAILLFGTRRDFANLYKKRQIRIAGKSTLNERLRNIGQDHQPNYKHCRQNTLTKIIASKTQPPKIPQSHKIRFRRTDIAG